MAAPNVEKLGWAETEKQTQGHTHSAEWKVGTERDREGTDRPQCSSRHLRRVLATFCSVLPSSLCPVKQAEIH